MSSTKPSILMQREVSLLTGAEREAPQRRIRPLPGAIRIGREIVRYHTQQEFEDQERLTRETYNAEKQARHAHECISEQMGQYCPHA